MEPQIGYVAHSPNSLMFHAGGGGHQFHYNIGIKVVGQIDEALKLDPTAQSPNKAAFNVAFGKDSIPYEGSLWDYLSSHPEEGGWFHSLMEGHTRSPLNSTDHLAAYDWSQLGSGTLVDLSLRQYIVLPC